MSARTVGTMSARHRGYRTTPSVNAIGDNAQAVSRVVLTIDRDRLRAFAEDGYVVLPQVVSTDLVDRARREVAARRERDPPRPGHRGPHFYFVTGGLPQPLLAPLCESGALALAESLIAPARFDEPDHVQISLSIPMYFRLRRAGHRERWRKIVQDPLLEFEPVRAAVSGP